MKRGKVWEDVILVGVLRETGKEIHSWLSYLLTQSTHQKRGTIQQ